MHTRSRLLSWPLLLVAVLGAASCDDAPMTPETSLPGNVLLDVSGTLDPVADARDTFELDIPSGRVMGTIIESSELIFIRYGPSRYDVIWSGSGGALAAITEEAGPRPIRLVVMRGSDDVEETNYRLRVVAVNASPERGSHELSPGTTFRREWIDPPLDLDVFAFDLEEGERVYLELKSHVDDVPITAVVFGPSGLRRYLLLAAGTELTRSSVYEADESGEYRLWLYSAGLSPDVEAEYRFRIVAREPAE